MITLKLKDAKAGFFDRQKVVNATDAATRKVLSKFGAFVRTRARSSIRKRKAVSVPGSPPTNRVGLLRQFLFFSYDSDRKSVVIGPAKLNGRVSSDALPALEYGGTSTIEGVRFRGGKKVRTRKRVNIKARPFMGPALTQELPKLEGMWRDSVKAK